MPQKDHVMALSTPDPAALDDDMRAYFEKCEEKIGFVPNVIRSYAKQQDKLRIFIQMYGEWMLSKTSGLSKLEREMVAVVVSSVNRCFYCLTAHGQAVRELSGDPQLGEMLVMNYRAAPLAPRVRAMLDFAWKLTAEPHAIEDADRAALFSAGLTEDDVFDLANVVGFFNMSNRVAAAVDMTPNPDYHTLNR